jgi:hypothetical protein
MRLADLAPECALNGMSSSRRLTKSEWQFVAGVAVLIGCACAPARPTPLDFSGDWAGTTSQGRSIVFTVSPGLVVTSLSVDYVFGGCSGTVTVNPAAGTLFNTGGTASAAINYLPQGGRGPNRTIVNFLFPSPTTANGALQFLEFSTCGSAMATWAATKR